MLILYNDRQLGFADTSLPKARIRDAGGPRETRLYPVKVDLKVRNAVSYNSGPQVRFLTLRRETSVTVAHRVHRTGTGP